MAQLITIARQNEKQKLKGQCRCEVIFNHIHACFVLLYTCLKWVLNKHCMQSVCIAWFSTAKQHIEAGK